ncbi:MULTISPECIES: DUF2789 domain-containing protein [unclassified Methylophilus]|jgi:hypothetical protein|uniref:DUF2789 domain-containing protein n=1 Tax=unclassified Methylophilus TaxID=2630143 RepID=UPI0007019FD4|nr:MULTISPECIES: DUF2789 domain-containing protein [unclassified Methylophilus]KQT36721.1 hypothetical protein ASG24_06150 [Methylophilus sp. Leaf414]KQT41188.1 hypothetical protein ASG34_10530 [Methylophilus sp. Leaf416]KQT58398.1 hypothetical protein ASG44_12085 [Methylophilus sp. Leaf459]
MEPTQHTLNNLFAQLGLPASDQEIETFIQTHSHLAGYLTLAEAPYWTPAQAAFLREEILKDADWAEVIDQLNARLHKK